MALISGPFSPNSTGQSTFSGTSATQSEWYGVGVLLGESRLIKYVLNAASTAVVGTVSAIVSSILSKLPSLPVAMASPLCELEKSATCRFPLGTYVKTCDATKVTFLEHERMCKLYANCFTFGELQIRSTSAVFSPEHAALYGNSNGKLFGENTFLTDTPKPAPATVFTATKDPQAGKTKIQAESHDWIKKYPSFQTFHTLAKDTESVMYYAEYDSQNRFLPLMESIEQVFTHFTTKDSSVKAIDVAFLIDTTGSMTPYIDQIKENLCAFLKNVSSKYNEIQFQFAAIEFRDKGYRSKFVTRPVIDFNADPVKVEEELKNLKVAGGGDDPEAALDVLMAAKDRLHWNKNAKHVAILITDAAAHPKTIDGKSVTFVIDQLKHANIQLAVYPIVIPPKKV